MFSWLFVAFGVSVGSAVAPVISAEVFVLSLASASPGLPWLLVGAIVAIGQVAGKLVYYLGARGSIRLPKPLHNHVHRARRTREPSVWRDRWHARTKRIRGWLEALRERCHRHPQWMHSAYGLSSVFGLPPFMATTVLAGLMRMRLGAFLATGILGRFVRFSALAAAPALFTAWMSF